VILCCERRLFVREWDCFCFGTAMAATRIAARARVAGACIGTRHPDTVAPMGKLRGTLIWLAMLGLVGAGIAVAANPAADGKITACVSKKAKALRLASAKSKCKGGEKALTWNQRGPAGPAGADGQKGATGAPGTPGTNGQDGAAGTPGADASTTSRQLLASETTTSSPTEVATDGPDVTVTVPAGGENVVLGGNYDGKNANGANNSCTAIYEGSTRLGGLGCVTSSAYVRGHGALLVAADGGQHTYTMRYQSPGGSLASFQNVTLIVSVLR
jgi:Collagen triple helix repeat (20 copies)